MRAIETAGAPGRQPGFTLIELMIAMILGLIVVAGVVSVFLAGQQSFRTNDALAGIQDSSRVAFEMMARDIREAGLTGCNSVNDRIANVLGNGPGTATAQWWADWDSVNNNTIRGFDSATLDSAVAGAGALGGSSSLRLLAAGTDPVAIQSFHPTSGEFVLQAQAVMPSLSAGDVVMACSPGQAAIFQLGAYSAATRTATIGASTQVPGNTTSALNLPGEPACNPSSSPCFPPNSLLAKLTAVDWYVGTNADGTDSLYRMTLQNDSGTPTATPQEMVRGVKLMAVEYLNPSINALQNGFHTAATITTNNAWSGVTAVRVTLTVDSTFQRADVTGAKPIERKYSFTTNVRNRVN
jgi:type IV pilus assembly protein PilW